MNFWEKLRQHPPDSGKKEQGLWQDLLAKTDPTRYVPSKIGSVEERQLLSQRSGSYFVVKNREKIRYLKLTEQDHFLWSRIDGQANFGDLVMEYFQKFGAFAFNRISSLLDQLRNNYFLEEQPKKIFSSLSRREEKQTPFGKLMNLFRSFIQKEIPISRLDQGVTFLYKTLLWPFFTRVAKWFYVAVTVAGFGCFVKVLNSGSYAIIQTKGSYAVGVLILVGLQVAIILLHEGAHAFGAKSYGREVPRGGFMIYMGMPAFFVDTTDMWLESKWRRIAVSWAGPYSELIVGGIFSLTLILFPQCPANPILFKCAFLFYIGVFVNLNPLLELDGYYILVDLLEIPLLRRRSLKFVKKELWLKLKNRETFSREEKIFTVFGILAAAYTVFALTVAAYFWQTRIATTFVDLWHKGIGSKILVAFLVLATVAPVVLVLGMKLWQLLRWGWNKLSESPVLRGVNIAAPFLLGMVVLAAAACWRQPWIPHRWCWFGAALLLVLSLAHFLYHGRKFLFPASPWRELPFVAVAGTFAWLLQAGLSFAGHPEPSGLLEIVGLALLGLAALRSLRFLNGTWVWPILFLWGAFAAAAGAYFRPVPGGLAAAFVSAMLLSAGSFAVGVRQAASYRMQVRHMAQGGDEERLQQAFLSVLACFRRYLDFLFSKTAANSFWKKVKDYVGKEIPEMTFDAENFSFRGGLSILEKAETGKKVFEFVWGETNKALGPFWAKLLLEKTFDSLDWQERETLDQYVFKKEDWQKSLVRKASVGRRNLESILKGNFLFAELSPKEISTLSELFATESFRKGEAMIRQGDVGDKFYLIKQGKVRVRVKQENGVEEEVARLSEGDFFGEIALLKEVPRTATCLAETDVEVWSLDKASFTHYVKERFEVSSSVERAIENVRLLSAMPLFRELTPSQMRKLALRFTSRKAAAGETLICQADPGEEFFVIEKGECAVKIKGADGEEKTVAKLRKGEYFGEIALLSNAPRTATVEAVTPTEVLVLSKKDFDVLVKSTLQGSGNLEKVSSRRKLDLKKKALAGA